MRKAMRKMYKRLAKDAAKPDRLANKLLLAKTIEENQVAGVVVIRTSGRDCDGTYGESSGRVRASIMAVQHEIDGIWDNAEGPTSIWLEKPYTKYCDIVFMQDTCDDRQALDFLEGFKGDEDKAMIISYLTQWDNGAEMEHSLRETPSRGAEDDWHRDGCYILTWNTRLGYVGLERIVEN